MVEPTVLVESTVLAVDIRQRTGDARHDSVDADNFGAARVGCSEPQGITIATNSSRGPHLSPPGLHNP